MNISVITVAVCHVAHHMVSRGFTCVRILSKKKNIVDEYMQAR